MRELTLSLTRCQCPFYSLDILWRQCVNVNLHHRSAKRLLIFIQSPAFDNGITDDATDQVDLRSACYSSFIVES